MKLSDKNIKLPESLASDMHKKWKKNKDFKIITRVTPVTAPLGKDMRITYKHLAVSLGASRSAVALKNLTVAGACYTCGKDVNDPKRKRCLYMNSYV